jgi:hypothetical protein
VMASTADFGGSGEAGAISDVKASADTKQAIGFMSKS